VHYGAADGIFGNETLGTVRAFQQKEKLPPDGTVGKDTIRRLDELLYKAAVPPPPAPAPPPPLQTWEYTLGTNDPAVPTDPGAGAWKSKAPEASYFAMKVAILAALPGAAISIGDDAATHMMHYMRNTGLDYTIDLEGMVVEVPSGKDRYEHEVAQMQAFVEKLPLGNHFFTSRRPNLGTNPKEESRNWFFAIGSYVSWGKGVAKVGTGPSIRSYDVEFEYKFFDRYNWDKGKKVELAGITITDVFMGEFHRQGLAKEFNCYGSLKRKLAWKQGEAIAESQMHPGRGRGG
jgi:hypothetical protein